MVQYTPQYVGVPYKFACQQAVVATVLLDFKVASEAGTVMFREIDRLFNAKPGQYTFKSDAVIENFIRLGGRVVVGESMQYQEDTFKMYEEHCGTEVAKIYMEHENAVNRQATASKHPLSSYPKYTKLTKAPTSDIVSLLKQNYLVQVWVDSSKMGLKENFAGHFLLLYRADGEQVYFHDSGNVETRGAANNVSARMSLDHLDYCRRYPTGNTDDYSAFKLP